MTSGARRSRPEKFRVTNAEHRDESPVTPRDPYPAGWYGFRYSHELRPGRVLRARYFGKELVAFRSEAGEAHVLDAHCAHLGAHLGDGRVQGELLECPFHGWRWDGAGGCAHVPFCDDAPARARVGSYPVLERNGVVYFWHDPGGAAPFFDVPQLPELAGGDFKPGPTHRQTIRGWIHDPRENAVDTTHGPILHGRSFPVVPGSKGEVRHWHEDASARTLTFQVVNLIGKAGSPREVVLDFSLAGPGHLVMRSSMPTEIVYVVPNVPVDEAHIDFTLMTWVRRSKVPLLDTLLVHLTMRHFLRGLREDYAIFERKAYLREPALSAADGPILKMRRWLRGFEREGGAELGDSAS